MARSTLDSCGAFRAVVEVTWDDGHTTTHWYGPYDEEGTAVRVRSHKTNPRFFADYTRWSPPGPKPVSAAGHVEAATGWEKVPAAELGYPPASTSTASTRQTSEPVRSTTNTA